ncbi:MAG: enolase C-terminal domain-like protein [Pirellulaceae bacterium]
MHRRRFIQVASATGGSLILKDLRSDVRASDRVGNWNFDQAAANRELAAHRIVKITGQQVRDRYPRSIGPNSRGRPVGGGGSYRVRTIATDKGAEGWAMCHLADEAVQPFIGMRVGDLFDVETGSSDEAGALDKALHDLAGNILGLPVWKLIGAAGPRQTLLYSGAIYMEDVWPPDARRGIPAVLAACQQDYDAGYRAFKLKIGRGFKWMPRKEGLQRDIEVTRAVKKRFPDCRILVDANDAFTVDEAIKYVQSVADCDLYWIEEPFEEDYDGLKRLKDSMANVGCRALLADGERRKRQAKPLTRHGGYVEEFTDRLYRLAEAKLVDVFVLDLGIVGFTRWRRLMPKLIKAGIKASPHLWMWTPRTYYCAQFAAGVGNVCIIEGIPGRAPEIDYSAYKITDGKLVVPDTPGFGLKLI